MQQLPIRNITPEELIKYDLGSDFLVRPGNEIAHEQSVLKVRKWYAVAHCVLEFEERGFVLVPVNPFFHADKQFTPAPAHYHVDGRFDYAYGFHCDKGKTLTAIFAPGVYEDRRFTLEYNMYNGEKYHIRGLLYLRKKCRRLTTGLTFDRGMPTVFRLWKESMIGKSCAGKKCPHYGTTMIDEGDRLVCPMHNLVGSKETMLIIAND